MQLNALIAITSLILRDDLIDVSIIQIEREWPDILPAVIKRGLKSCSSNEKALTRTLQSIHRLLELDSKDGVCTWTSPLKVAARLIANDGLELLTEV